MRFRIPSLLMSGVLMLSVMAATSPVQISAAPRSQSPASVVATYHHAINSILRGASTSQLAQIYAPDATLVVATPDGQTSSFHGLPAISGWYKTFAAGHVGIQLKQVSMRTPVPGMVVLYEVAVKASGSDEKGRCAHVFAVANGMIVSDDFIVYYGG